MYEEITRDMTAEEMRTLSGRRNWVVDYAAPVGCFTISCLVVSVAIAGGVTLVSWLTSTLPPQQPASTFFTQTFGITAAVITAATVMLFTFGKGFGALGRAVRGRGRTLSTVETRATWDAAVVLWGLMDGELDILLLRVDPDTVWVTEASTLELDPSAADCPSGIRIVRHVGWTFDEGRVALRKLEPDEDLTGVFDREVGKQMALETLPEVVRNAFSRRGP